MAGHEVESQARDPVSADDPLLSIPERPHMAEATTAWLEARLRETKCFLEYGSGGSTRLAASLNVPRILSVESDHAFACALRDTVKASDSESALTVIATKFGPTGEWGMPKTFKEFRRWPNYALGVWDFVREHHLSPDLVLIDGRFRIGCFLASLLEARPGTPILFDDYVLRHNVYGIVERFVSPSQLIDDDAAVFFVPEAVPQREVAWALARFVSIPE